jgi:hypothetical protein
MHRCPPHVAHVLAFESSPARLMHHTRVVLRWSVSSMISEDEQYPDDDIPVVLPFDCECVLLLCCVLEKLLDDDLALFLGLTIEMVSVVSDVQGGSSARLMHLHESVTTHEVLFRAHASEKLAVGSGQSSTMPQRMVDYIVFDLSLDALIKVCVRRARVCKRGRSTCALWWELMRSQDGIPCTTRIER